MNCKQSNYVARNKVGVAAEQKRQCMCGGCAGKADSSQQGLGGQRLGESASQGEGRGEETALVYTERRCVKYDLVGLRGRLSQGVPTA